MRRAEDQLAGFLGLVVLTQPLHAREDITGVVACGGGHRVEKAFGVFQTLDDRDARLRDGKLVAAETFRRAQARLGVVLVKTFLHAHAMIFWREQAAEQAKHFVFDRAAGILPAPGVLDELGCSDAIATGEQHPRQHIPALGRSRLMVSEKSEHPGIVDPIVPQRVFGAAAEQRDVRPVGVVAHESGVALEGRVGVVRAQDHPFGELAGDRVGNGLLGRIGVGVAAFACGRDDGFHRCDVGIRGGNRRRDGEGAGNGPHHAFEGGATRKESAVQADIGLSEGRHAGLAVLRPLARERQIADNREPRCLGAWVSGRAGLRNRNRLVFGRRQGRSGRQDARGRQCQAKAQRPAFEIENAHSTPDPGSQNATRRPPSSGPPIRPRTGREGYPETTDLQR